MIGEGKFMQITKRILSYITALSMIITTLATIPFVAKADDETIKVTVGTKEERGIISFEDFQDLEEKKYADGTNDKTTNIGDITVIDAKNTDLTSYVVKEGSNKFLKIEQKRSKDTTHTQGSGGSNFGLWNTSAELSKHVQFGYRFKITDIGTVSTMTLLTRLAGRQTKDISGTSSTEWNAPGFEVHQFANNTLRMYIGPTYMNINTDSWYRVLFDMEDTKTGTDIKVYLYDADDTLLYEGTQTTTTTIVPFEAMNFSAWGSGTGECTINVDDVLFRAVTSMTMSISEQIGYEADLNFTADIPLGYTSLYVDINDENVYHGGESVTNGIDHTFFVPSSYLKIGENTIKLKACYDEDTVIETSASVTKEPPEYIPQNDKSYIGTPEFFRVDMTNYESASLILDGDYLGEVDEEGLFYIEDELYAGEHILKIIATKQDNSKQTQTVNFDIDYKHISKKLESDFNSFKKASDASKYGFSYSLDRYAELVATTGASSASDDKAMKLQFAPGGKTLDNYPYIETSKFKNFTDGLVEIEFDIKLNSVATLLKAEGFKRGTTNVDFTTALPDGSSTDSLWAGTNVATKDEWVKVKLIIDNDDETYTMYVDNKLAVDRKSAPAEDGFDNSVFRLGIDQNTSLEADSQMGFSIDNFKAYMSTSYKGIKKLSYIKSNGQETNSNTDIAVDSKLCVYMEEGLKDDESINTQNVKLLTSDGVSIPVKEVSYDDDKAALIVTPHGNLPSNSEISVVLTNALSFADGVSLGVDHVGKYKVEPQIWYSFTYFQVNGVDATCAYEVSEGDMVSVYVDTSFIGDDFDENDVFVFAEYNDGRLVQMTAKTLNEPYGYFELGLPDASKTGSVFKLMIFSDYINMKSLSGPIIFN